MKAQQLNPGSRWTTCRCLCALLLATVMPLAAETALPAGDRIEISKVSNSSDSATLVIRLRTSPTELKVHLNGKDVKSHFSRKECDGDICEEGTLTAADGLRTDKNVLAVDAGRGMTGRLRFDNALSSTTAPAATAPLALGIRARASAVSMGIATPFLPPTISFNTRTSGGWNGQVDPVNNSWFMVGTQGYPTTQPANCGPNVTATYMAVVLDRQRLTEKTTAPESSPQCFADEASLKTYLATLTAADLAIVGSNLNHSPGPGLDTTPIGGTAYTGAPGQNSSYPAGYMAIGAGGAAKGSAYEAYFVARTGYEQVNAFANGTLQEDAYGNYNYQSSQVVEYAVSPNDPSYLTPSLASVVSIDVMTPTGSIRHNVYTPPVGTNGYWLLTVSRYSLNTYPYACNQGGVSQDGTEQFIPNCGKFYATGSSDPVVSKAAYLALASDLSSVNAWQLAFLTTVGQPAFGGSTNSIWSVGGFTAYGSASNGFQEFSSAVAALGGAPNLTQSLLSPTSAYTLISSPGIGGPLNGNAIESTTALSSQGQTGLVHGILQRNLNGLFMPQQSNQESMTTFAAKGGLSSSEYKLAEVALQQPVDWPSSSSSVLLSGADSTAGQVAAYRYLSYVLLTEIYLKGIQGSHLDDIHYFFTGSANTTINIHTYDPATITFPTLSTIAPYGIPCSSLTGTTCTSLIFGQNDPLVFTQNDLAAVKNQLSAEIRYLTYTLQFMVTGSTNMKDVIAGGNSNVGLALTGAAATILGSKLVPAPPVTVVQTSWQNIVSMIGGIASLTSAIPGLGEIAGLEELGTSAAKIFGGTASAVGSVASIAAGAGGVTSNATSNQLPSAFSKFATTIGDLASGSMQGQLSSGFDTLTDSLTSDWGRLSVIGPMVVDSNNPVFFAPNQVAQNVAVSALTQAASRSFYLALMPSFYSVHYWQGVSGDVNTPANNIPDMGYNKIDPNAYFEFYCNAYYLNPQANKTPAEVGDPLSGLGTMPVNTSVWYPSPAGTPKNFTYDYSATPIDYYVIAGATTGSGSDSPRIQVLDTSLASNLFTKSGLNLPMDEFVTQLGPMSSVWVNGAAKNPAGHRSDTVCNARIYPSFFISPPEPGGAKNVGSAPTSSIATSTTLTAPSTALVGGSVSLTATVKAGTAPVPSGVVYFLDNGVIVNTVSLEASGTASAMLQNVTAGPHSIQAKYGRVSPYATSSSPVVTMGVYSTTPDLNLSMSSTTLSATYGLQSAPISIQVTSLSGLGGNVTFSCSGLPIGMNCNFNPIQVTIAPGSMTTTSLTISSLATQASNSITPASWIGLLTLPLSLLFIEQGRRRARRTPVLFASLVLGFAGLANISGCASGSNANTIKETGSKTILVTASCGSVAHSLPLMVTIQ